MLDDRVFVGLSFGGLRSSQRTGDLLAVEFSLQEEDRGAAWCHDVVRQWDAEGLLFSASYRMPDELLQGPWQEF
jgi:hypothetical protein